MMSNRTQRHSLLRLRLNQARQRHLKLVMKRLLPMMSNRTQRHSLMRLRLNQAPQRHLKLAILVQIPEPPKNMVSITVFSKWECRILCIIKYVKGI